MVCSTQSVALGCSLTAVFSSHQVVPVRPFRHDEYERFITAAYPYYVSAASTMAAFFLLGIAVLYTK